MMNKNDKTGISVIVPVHNGEKTIARCLDSILNQTLLPDEVIVVDDGSTDQTRSIVESYGGRVRYLYQSNRGAAAARNTGTCAARYEWIAYQDADDVWKPDKLACQMALLRKYPELDWVSSALERQDGSLDLDPRIAAALLNGKDYFDSVFQALYFRAWAYTIVLIVRRSLLLRTGLFRVTQKCNHDLDLYLRLAYLAPRIGYINRPLAVYHFHQANISSQPIAGRLPHMTSMYRRHLWMARRYPEHAEFIRQFFTMLIGHNLCECIRLSRWDWVRRLHARFGHLLSFKVKCLLSLLAIFPFLINLRIQFTLGKKRLWQMGDWINKIILSDERKKREAFAEKGGQSLE